MVMKKKTKTNKLETIWSDPKNPNGYTSVSKLKKASGKSFKETKKWLSNRLDYSLNKPLRRRFPTRSYKTSGINDLWQADLMEMIPYGSINNGYKYILTCIDVFSRFARASPLKTKSAKDVSVALETMFKDSRPKHLQTDLGKEFYNSTIKNKLQSLNINHYSVFSQYKAAYVERFNRTLRERLKKYFTKQGNKKWVAVLDKIVWAYNHSKHSGLFGLSPVEVTNKTAMKLWLIQNKDITKTKNGKYKTGDFVRISKLNGSPFIKNFDNNWSDEVYIIKRVDTKSKPTMYIIKDESNEVIQGKFYEQELQVIDKPDIYRIQKILKTKGIGKHKQYYVKWHGYSEPTWINANNII